MRINFILAVVFVFCLIAGPVRGDDGDLPGADDSPPLQETDLSTSDQGNQELNRVVLKYGFMPGEGIVVTEEGKVQSGPSSIDAKSLSNTGITVGGENGRIMLSANDVGTSIPASALESCQGVCVIKGPMDIFLEEGGKVSLSCEEGVPQCAIVKDGKLFVQGTRAIFGVAMVDASDASSNGIEVTLKQEFGFETSIGKNDAAARNAVMDGMRRMGGGVIVTPSGGVFVSGAGSKVAVGEMVLKSEGGSVLLAPQQQVFMEGAATIITGPFKLESTQDGSLLQSVDEFSTRKAGGTGIEIITAKHQAALTDGNLLTVKELDNSDKSVGKVSGGKTKINDGNDFKKFSGTLKTAYENACSGKCPMTLEEMGATLRVESGGKLYPGCLKDSCGIAQLKEQAFRDVVGKGESYKGVAYQDIKNGNADPAVVAEIGYKYLILQENRISKTVLSSGLTVDGETKKDLVWISNNLGISATTALLKQWDKSIPLTTDNFIRESLTVEKIQQASPYYRGWKVGQVERKISIASSYPAKIRGKI